MKMRKGFDAELEQHLRFGRMAKMREVLADFGRRSASGSSESADGQGARRGPRTPAANAARRQNAKKSTGPRTAKGKGRAALNAAKRRLCPKNDQLLMALEGRDPFQYRRLHRQLIYWFQPRHSYTEGLVADLAERWWKKLGSFPNGIDSRFSRDLAGTGRENESRVADEMNRRIEADLDFLFGALASHTRKWAYLLRKRFGTTLDLSEPAEHVRQEIESRLRAMGIATSKSRRPGGRLPAMPPASAGGGQESG